MSTFPLTTVESSGQVEDDARAEMVRLWDERTQFTRSELGGAPDWAQWVDKDGCLFDGIDACDAFNEMLDSTYSPIRIAGVRISPHMALWAQASDYKHKLGRLVARPGLVRQPAQGGRRWALTLLAGRISWP